MFESSKIRIASGSANGCRHSDLRNAPMTAVANFGAVNRVCAQSAKLQVLDVQGVSPTREKRPIPKISKLRRRTYFWNGAQKPPFQNCIDWVLAQGRRGTPDESPVIIRKIPRNYSIVCHLRHLPAGSDSRGRTALFARPAAANSPCPMAPLYGKMVDSRLGCPKIC